jgi:hypothetical protein
VQAKKGGREGEEGEGEEKKAYDTISGKGRPLQKRAVFF